THYPGFGNTDSRPESPAEAIQANGEDDAEDERRRYGQDDARPGRDDARRYAPRRRVATGLPPLIFREASRLRRFSVVAGIRITIIYNVRGIFDFLQPQIDESSSSPGFGIR